MRTAGLLLRVWSWYVSLAFIGDPEISLYRENPHWFESAVLMSTCTAGSSIFVGMMTGTFFDPKGLHVIEHAVLPGIAFPAFFSLVSVLVRGRFSVWYAAISSAVWPVSVVLLPWFIPRALAWRKMEIVREVMDS